MRLHTKNAEPHCRDAIIKTINKDAKRRVGFYQNKKPTLGFNVYDCVATPLYHTFLEKKQASISAVSRKPWTQLL